MNMSCMARYLRILLLAALCLWQTDTALCQAPPPTNFGGGFGGSYGSEPPLMRVAAAPDRGSMSAGELTPANDPVSLNSEAAGNSGEAAIQVGNLISIVREGGVLMFPIMFCSVVLVVFVMERLFYLRRGRIIPRPFVRGVLEQLEQNQLERDEAIELCEANGSPIAELFIAALKKWGKPAVEVEQAILDAGERVTCQLKRYLRLFNAISNLTPLLGLLGTVLGMIDAFNSIAQANAMGRPEMLASGIGGALLTTAAGLLVAIPAYAAYAFFVGQTDRLILEMDALGQDVVELISADAQNGGRSRRSRKAA
jgi:biopolymer transport protein ExbB